MKITSIDNCYEDDGLANVYSSLGALIAQKPNDPLRDVLVAILPEYRKDGRLDRLNLVMVPAEDPGEPTCDLAELMEAADRIVKGEQAKRAAAYAALEKAPIVVVKR